MKVQQFTIPVNQDKSVILDQFTGPYHYPNLHRHREIQLTWIQVGEGTLISGNSVCHYKPGDIFMLGANLPHIFKSDARYFEPNEKKMVKSFTIFFNPEGKLAGLLNLPEMKPIRDFLRNYKVGIKIPDAFSKEVSLAMLAIKNSYGIKRIMNFTIMLNGFLNFGATVKPLSSYRKAVAISENVGIRVGNVYDYIMQNYSESITLEDVAKVACMTPESLCRYLKRNTGHTYIEFLNQMRIYNACKQLILHEFENIATVAYNCGFKSITNFNRVFKNIVGLSPLKYLDNYYNGVPGFDKPGTFVPANYRN